MDNIVIVEIKVGNEIGWVLVEDWTPIERCTGTDEVFIHRTLECAQETLALVREEREGEAEAMRIAA